VIGWIISSYSIAQLMAAPFWGQLSDRYGRRPALLVGLGASAVAYVIFGFAETVWLLFASRLIQGAGGGTTAVAQAYVADTVPPADRARALGWLSAASSAGIMTGPVVGSVAAHWGQEAPGLIAAGLCVINLLFAWNWLPESERGHAAAASGKTLGRAAWLVLRRPREATARIIWIYAVGMLAFNSLSSVLALYLEAEFGFTEKNIGYVFLYVGALSLVMRSLLLGPIVDRVGEAWTMRIGTWSLFLGLLFYPFAKNLWTLFAVMPLVPIGTALLFPSTTALMSRTSDKREFGVTMGIAQTFGGIARVTAPILSTTAFQRLGHDTPFYLAGGIVALVALLAQRVPADRA
jgi:MFS family permease